GFKSVVLAPSLLAQHRRWKNPAQIGYCRSAKQLKAAHRPLHLVLVFKVAIQRSFGAQLPVGRTRTHGAPTVGVVDIALNLFAGEIDARTCLFAAAEQMAKVNGSVSSSAMIGGQIDRLNS